MTIGIDCHNLEGKRTGMGRYLSNLLRQWSKLEVNPKSKIRNPKFILYFKDYIPEDVPKSGNFESRVLKSKSTACFIHYLLPKAAEKDRVELFFSPSYVLPLRISKKIKTAVTIHDVSYEAHPEWFSWQNNVLLRFVSRKSAQKADIVIAPSEFSKKETLKYYRVNPDKIFVVPLAAEEKFKQAEVKQEIKEKYGIKNKFIFYTGAIFNRRYIPECVEAFKQIAQKFPEYQFLISGMNYTHPHIDVDYIIKKANENIGRKAILRIDYADEDDLVYLYGGADLFIWLSSYEGFGLPPLEALACGTPVVTTQMGSLSESVGNAAVFIKNLEDIKEISKTMEELLSNEQFSKDLISKGLVQAQKFSWRKTAEETLKILNREQK